MDITTDELAKIINEARDTAYKSADNFSKQN